MSEVNDLIRELMLAWFLIDPCWRLLVIFRWIHRDPLPKARLINE